MKPARPLLELLEQTADLAGLLRAGENARALELSESIKAGLSLCLRSLTLGDDKKNDLESKNRLLKTKLARLVQVNRRMAESYESVLAAFDKFRSCIETVQSMERLKDLPQVMDRITQTFSLDRVGLVLCLEDYIDFAPQCVILKPQAEIEKAGRAFPGPPENQGCFLGPTSQLKQPGFFFPDWNNDPPLSGSCFIRLLCDRFNSGKSMGFLALADADPSRYSKDMATDFIEHFCEIFADNLLNAHSHEKLKRESAIDPLTGIHNRLYFNQHAPRLLELSERNKRPACLLFIDLDKFKPINDRFGHEAGDEFLIQTARALSRISRKCDIAARVGGDEFVVFLPDAAPDDAKKIIQRIKKEIESIPVKNKQGEESGLRVGASIGLAEHQPGTPLEDLVRQADQEMYRSKKG